MTALVVASACAISCGDSDGNLAASMSVHASAPISAASSPSATAPASVAPSPSVVLASPRNTIAERFAGPTPPGLKPAAIYSGAQQSGVIVLLPAELNMNFWGFGVGFQALATPSPGVVLANLSIEVTFGANALEPGPARLAARCDGRWFKNGVWSQSESIQMSGGQALVWLGTDAGGSGRAPRHAYLLEGLFGSKKVLACGSWDPAHPELEAAVATALKSIQLGKAPPGNFEN